MLPEKLKWGIVIFVCVATFGLGGWLTLRLTPAQNEWSALGMLLWVVIAALFVSCFANITPERRRHRRFILFSTLFSWIALGSCAPNWHMNLPINGPSSLFTVIYPATIPATLISSLMSAYLFRFRPSMGGVEREAKIEAFRNIALPLGICCVAVSNLIGFFGQMSLATKLFMEFFVIFSALTLRQQRMTKR